MSPSFYDAFRRPIRIAEFAFYFVHFIFGYYFVKKTMRISLMHPNLRLIMSNVIVEYTLIGVGRMGSHLVSQSPQFPYHSTMLCAYFRVLQDAGCLIAGLTFLWIALERLMATVLIRTYEKKDGRVALTIVTTSYVVAFLAALTLTVHDWIATDGFNPRLTESCETSHTHPALLPTFVILCGVNYLVVSAMLIMLYRYNKRRRINARDVPLSGRYQYAENVATLAVLVPSVLIWGVVCLVAEMFEPFFYVAWKNGDRDTQVFISESVYLLAALNSVVCPLAFVLKYGPLNNALKYDLQRVCFWRTQKPRNKSIPYVSVFQLQESTRSMEQRVAIALEATNKHFHQLQDMWWK